MNRNTNYIFSLIFLCFLGITLNQCKSDSSNDIELETIEVDQTLVLLDSLIQQDPRNSDYYYDRALYYKELGIQPKAVADIYSALHIDSSNVEYYLLAGSLFLEMGEGDKASALMSKGINLNPGNEDLYLKAIEYNYYMQNYEAALNFSNDLIEKNKYNAEAYFYKGMIFKEIQKENNAISTFQTCIEVDPNYYDAHMQLGLIYSENEDDLAIQYFKNALKLSENSREAMYAIAYHKQRKEEYRDAISSYKNMIQKDPNDHEIFFNIGHCYIKLDSLEKAYNQFDIATKLHPQYAGAYYLKGNISETLGNISDAKVNYGKALKMLPNDLTILEAVERLKEVN